MDTDEVVGPAREALSQAEIKTGHSDQFREIHDEGEVLYLDISGLSSLCEMLDTKQRKIFEATLFIA